MTFPPSGRDFLGGPHSFGGSALCTDLAGKFKTRKCGSDPAPYLYGSPHIVTASQYYQKLLNYSRSTVSDHNQQQNVVNVPLESVQSKHCHVTAGATEESVPQEVQHSFIDNFDLIITPNEYSVGPALSENCAPYTMCSFSPSENAMSINGRKRTLNISEDEQMDGNTNNNDDTFVIRHHSTIQQQQSSSSSSFFNSCPKTKWVYSTPPNKKFYFNGRTTGSVASAIASASRVPNHNKAYDDDDDEHFAKPMVMHTTGKGRVFYKFDNTVSLSHLDGKRPIDIADHEPFLVESESFPIEPSDGSHQMDGVQEHWHTEQVDGDSDEGGGHNKENQENLGWKIPHTPVRQTLTNCDLSIIQHANMDKHAESTLSSCFVANVANETSCDLEEHFLAVTSRPKKSKMMQSRVAKQQSQCAPPPQNAGIINWCAAYGNNGNDGVRGRIVEPMLRTPSPVQRRLADQPCNTSPGRSSSSGIPSSPMQLCDVSTTPLRSGSTLKPNFSTSWQPFLKVGGGGGSSSGGGGGGASVVSTPIGAPTTRYTQSTLSQFGFQLMPPPPPPPPTTTHSANKPCNSTPTTTNSTMNSYGTIVASLDEGVDGMGRVEHSFQFQFEDGTQYDSRVAGKLLDSSGKEKDSFQFWL